MNAHKNKKILGKTLYNSAVRAKNGLPFHVGGHRLLNAGGDIDPSGAGFNYIITTMSNIRAEVLSQKFYEIAPGEYMPVDVGESAWADETVQNVKFIAGDSFFTGDVNTQDSTSRIANVNSGLDKLRQPNKPWSKTIGWNIIQIAMAAFNNNWDIVESDLESLKTNWDLGIQEVSFLGHPDGTINGLLNDPEATINTTLIDKPLSTMTETEFTAFCAGLLPAYWNNANKTAMPDTFVMPSSDYLGMGVPYSSSFPNISKLQYLTDMMKLMTRNPSFEILPLAYSDAAENAFRGINKNRYSLYRNDAKSGKMSIPVDFSMQEADTANKMNFTQGAIGQYSGYLLNYKKEMLYFDETI